MTERQNVGTYEYILLLTSDVHRFERIFEPVKRCMNTGKMFSKLTHIENTTSLTTHEKIKVWCNLHNENYVTLRGDCKFIVNQIDKTMVKSRICMFRNVVVRSSSKAYILQ